MTPDLLTLAAAGLGACLLLAIATWALSVRLHDVSIVDIAWGPLVVTPGVVAAFLLPLEPRALAVLAIALAWALRLALYIFWRHRGHGEDRRYQKIRERNEPNFALKSLYLVFGLQAVLAVVVAAPLLAAFLAQAPFGLLDVAGLALALFGLGFETVGDAQLARFKADPGNKGKVMDSGLWRYTRHPNYFGEFCLWWGLGLVALGTGAWWALASPLLMTVLLLKVSGVSLLEDDLRERRPQYRDYAQRTNAFFPGKPHG